MEGPPDEKSGKKPSLASSAPDVIVVTKPTELVVTEGAPDWAGLDGTGSLLYVKNTDANVFVDMDTQQNYVVVSGRWFTSKGLNGPWSYVNAKDLPPAFARIPDDSPKENVKASIPGTTQAKEAIIATQIPQMAQVDRAKATFSPQVAGAPDIKPIDGTQLKYVVNSSAPLIQATDGAWYALQKAVWFTAPAMQGPWSVAASVPAEVYAIPASSPLYYATYVRIYDVTPATVTVGYLPGYMGTYVSDGTLVYGTGYAYAPYIGNDVWYAPPVTYGYAAGIAWTPWTGWGYGFGMGWAYGAAWGAAAWGWGAAPYWGAYAGAAWGAAGAYGAWGPGAWAASSGNTYHQWGNTTAVSRSSAGYNAWTGNAWSGQAGHSYNSQTGQISAGQRGSRRQRLHRKLCERDARCDVQPHHRRFRFSRARHGRQRVHGTVDERRARERQRTRRQRRARGDRGQRSLRRRERQRLQEHGRRLGEARQRRRMEQREQRRSAVDGVGGAVAQHG
jgi:hypothetical protein